MRSPLRRLGYVSLKKRTKEGFERARSAWRSIGGDEVPEHLRVKGKKEEVFRMREAFVEPVKKKKRIEVPEEEEQ